MKEADKERLGLEPAFEENDHAIVFCADENFVPYTAVTIYSILEKGSPENYYDFFLLHRGVSEDGMKLLSEMIEPFPNASLRFINVEEWLGGRSFYTGTDGRFTEAAYYRLLIPEIFAGAFSKVLYMDGDMLALDDVAQLFDTELGDCLVAACRDLGCVRSYLMTPSEQAYWRDQLHLSAPNDYFNSGLVLFHVPAFHEAYSAKELLDLAASENWRQHDMSVLNLVCAGRTKILPAAWNATKYLFEDVDAQPDWFQEDLRQAYTETKIYHFIANGKPWIDFATYQGNQWWETAARTPFLQKCLYEFKFSDRMSGKMMVKEFESGRIGARWLVKSAKAWLRHKLKRGRQ